MMRVYTCLTQDHAPPLLLLAVLVCLAGSVVTIGVLNCAIRARGWSRAGWLLLCGVSGGAAIWCTHFIAILAYQPAQMLSISPLLTMASLLLAILGSGLGFTLAIGPGWLQSRAIGPWLGGLVLGAAIAGMHYSGMLALGTGTVIFDRSLLLASLLFSVLLATGSTVLAARAQGAWPAWLGAAVCFGLGILSLHMTGMGAILQLPPVQELGRGDVQAPLALAVGALAMMVLGSAAAACLIEHHSEADGSIRMRRLADSAIEGLAITLGGRIVEANASFQAMVGLPRAQLIGRELLGELLPPLHLPADVAEAPALETSLRRADGSLLDVELMVRDNVPLPGKRVFALRDLRERREQERRINHLALHDPLTGLLNRARFTQQMEQMLRKGGKPVALLHIGLDRFKQINEQHGHAGGDVLLRGFGRRLSMLLPNGGLATRLGGDEFAMLKPYAREHEIHDLIARIESAAAEPDYLAGAEIATTAAIGVALFPEDATTGEALLADADVALRRAKARPTRGACFYQADRDAGVRQRRRLGEDLRNALAQGQLEVFFQVQVSVASNTPCGHEALLRWRHPEHGMVSPAQFIPLAEESGLILPLGEWVLRQSCIGAAREPRLGKVAVNLSPVQFAHADLPRLVAEVLAETRLDPARLELEITESTLMKDEHQTLDVLRRLKALGVGVAMDDFGTGYSSLGTLRAFPFDKIKLDRSFMREIESSSQALAILRAVLGIGRGLNIPVLAEGVETQAELARLRIEQCEEAQGFLFGRPAPLRDLFGGLGAGHVAA